MTNEEIEEKYYPLSWEIAKGEIEIHCKNGKLLPSDHDIYTIEYSFIMEQIKRGDYLGDIECI